MEINNLLSRFDISTYQDILGDEIIGTLKELGANYLYSEQLNKILLNNFSKEELLLNSNSRNKILEVLREEEANRLLTHLNGEEHKDPWKKLFKLKFKGETLKKLFFFFGLNMPIYEKAEWIDELGVTPNYPLYDYQRSVIKKINTVLSSTQNRVLLHMPTGSGKTRTSISFICQYLIENENTNVVWFANTVELLDQAFNEFVRAWRNLGNRELKTIKYWSESEVDLSQLKGCFIVAGLNKTYNTLLNDVEKMSSFASNCSLVIMDEAHQAIAPSYKLLLETMLITRKASLIGLSATPGRTWNEPEEDLKLAQFFFKQKAKIHIKDYSNPVDYLIKEGYLAKTNNTQLLYKSGIELSAEDIDYLKENYKLPNEILEKISKDRLRNLTIISKLKQLVNKHSRIILFGITKDHAVTLNSLLTAIDINSNVLTSDTEKNERTRIIEKFKKPINLSPEPQVLCNYGILTTGFDAPETSCAVIARPTDSLVLYSQMVGRAIRGVRSGGNTEAEIVTVVDEKLPGFGNVSDAFENWEDIWDNV